MCTDIFSLLNLKLFQSKYYKILVPGFLRGELLSSIWSRDLSGSVSKYMKKDNFLSKQDCNYCYSHKGCAPLFITRKTKHFQLIKSLFYFFQLLINWWVVEVVGCWLILELLRFIEINWNVLKFTEMYWKSLKLLRLAEINRDLLKWTDNHLKPKINWYLLKYSENLLNYWGLLRWTEIYWDLLKLTEIYWDLLKLTDIYSESLRFTDIYSNLLKINSVTEIYWNYTNLLRTWIAEITENYLNSWDLSDLSTNHSWSFLVGLLLGRVKRKD